MKRLMAIALLISVMPYSFAEASGLPGSSGAQTLHAAVQNGMGCDGCQVLVRKLDSFSAVQFDVAVGDVVVSFIAAWGVDQRSICELVFVDEMSWFGWCDVHDYRFGSFGEWMDERPQCRNCTKTLRYSFGAKSFACGVTPLGDGGSSSHSGDLGLQATLEMSSWTEEQVVSTRGALLMVGSLGSPIIGRELAELFGIDTAPTLTEDDLSPLPEMPDEIRVLLDMHQFNGLTDWLEYVVDRIP